mmetsp:Transcript_18106/g.46346  ORF Transcript_18106/g.46346 Transcript_18106/m.46346 type:complete len:303 (-) Transcript_18106:537-1445(-)
MLLVTATLDAASRRLRIQHLGAYNTFLPRQHQSSLMHQRSRGVPMGEEQHAACSWLHSPRLDHAQRAHGRRIKRCASTVKVLIEIEKASQPGPPVLESIKHIFTIYQPTARPSPIYMRSVHRTFGVLEKSPPGVQSHYPTSAQLLWQQFTDSFPDGVHDRPIHQPLQLSETLRVILPSASINLPSGWHCFVRSVTRHRCSPAKLLALRNREDIIQNKRTWHVRYLNSHSPWCRGSKLICARLAGKNFQLLQHPRGAPQSLLAHLMRQKPKMGLRKMQPSLVKSDVARAPLRLCWPGQKIGEP